MRQPATEQASVFDPDQVPLSTSEGRRPPSTAGDRMMVGLAALALIGGLLIAASRLIPEQPNQTSQATATPAQSAEAASPSPQPTPLPRPVRSMTVDPAPRPGLPPPGPYVSEWVRMRIGVTLLESPSSDRTTGRLRPGQPAYISDAPTDQGGFDGWLQVDGPVSGWLFGEIDDDAMFERFPSHWQSTSGVYGLGSAASGFVAFGWGGSEEVMLASSDGARWHTFETPAVAWGRTAADGPAGWLMAGNVDSPDTTRITLWQSPDATSWERLGALPEEMTGGSMTLAGSQAGYVLLSETGSGGSAVWFSADGLLWTERPLAQLHPERGPRLTATPLGFFAWSLNEPTTEAYGSFSADGWTWSEANPLGPGQIVDVVADGDHLLALGRGPGGVRMWRGTIQGEQLTWSHDNTAPFRAAMVSRMVSDGERVVVLGWDRATETSLWWQRDGMSWQRHTMPADFDGLPKEAVGGPHGIVAVGQLASEGGRAPLFWHLGDGVAWEREQSPVMPSPAPPSPQTCGPKPRDLLGLLSADTYWAAICFGDEPITVRGWSAACEGCYSRSEGVWKTEWLAQPAEARVIHLAPYKTNSWGAVDGVLHPSVQGQPPHRRWLEVTGHFDDPAATSCRWIPTLADEYWYSGADDIVAGCRARFVVTAVRAVRGP